MSTFSSVVRNFIRDCEVLQALLAQGDKLTDEELTVITFSAIDLLKRVKSSKNSPELRAD